MYTEDEKIEKFGVVNEDGELVIDRTKLMKAYIDRGVNVLSEQETLKEDLKAIVAEAKEDGFDKAEISALIKHAFRNRIAEEIEQLEAIQSKLDNLYGGEDQ